jgi:hypothetical protein
MKTALINHKMSFLLLTLMFIGFSTVLISCDSISTDTKDKIKSEAQDLGNELNQTVNKLVPQLENGLEQADVQLSPPIATVQEIWAATSWYGPTIHVSLKPTSTAIANKQYDADLYEKGILRQTIPVSWNQPELNVLKEKVVFFSCSEDERDAYFGEDISHIFTVKVHE